MMKDKIIDKDYVIKQFTNNISQEPFFHSYCDDFFSDDVGQNLAYEFPEFDDEVWHAYSNPLEVKKTLNVWNEFPPLTYKVFSFLNSPDFISILQSVTKVKDLYPDMGLNGGGWHIHASGGKLNTHLDYNIHPKMGLQRKLNIIIYVTPGWDSKWGGSLGLWNGDDKEVGDLVKTIDIKFNRAVIFDTTQNSWHGLPDPIKSPLGIYRKSLAAYYLTSPPSDTEERSRALFAPSHHQKGNKEIEDLIKKRATVHGSKSVYRS